MSIQGFRTEIIIQVISRSGGVVVVPAALSNKFWKTNTVVWGVISSKEEREITIFLSKTYFRIAYSLLTMRCSPEWDCVAFMLSVPHFSPLASWYQITLLDEQGHQCVSSLSRAISQKVGGLRNRTGRNELQILKSILVWILQRWNNGTMSIIGIFENNVGQERGCRSPTNNS